MSVFLYTDVLTIFGVMLIIKATSYSLNNPIKEILYQPTTDAIKTKCKSWIDTFGQRGCKTVGSLLIIVFAGDVNKLVDLSTFVGAILGVYNLKTIQFVGARFRELQENGMKIGEGSSKAV